MSRASEYRAKARAEVFDVVVPSGATFTLRPFDPEAWMMTGYVPEHIVRTFLELEQKGGAAVHEMLDDVGALQKFSEVMNSIICYSSIDPPIHTEAIDEDSLGVNQILYQDRKHLFLALTKQLPEAEVATIQGSVTVSAVTNFRDSAAGQTFVSAGGDGQ